MEMFDWHSQDSRASGPLEVAHTVTQQYGTGGGNTPMVVHDNLLCRATGQAGAETLTDRTPCLNCDHEAPIIAGCLNPEDNQSRRIYGDGGQAPALSARESAGAEQTGVLTRGTGGLYPRFAVWENVPGALSSNGGKDFGTVINTMLRIARPDEYVRRPGRWPNAANYGAIAYRIVDAQYWGVPQRRRRIYLVADFAGESAGDVVFERKGTPWHFDPRIPAGQTVAALAPDCYQWRACMVSEQGTVAFDGDAGATVNMTVYTERSPTLKASQKESVAIGLAAELEVAPTLPPQRGVQSIGEQPCTD